MIDLPTINATSGSSEISVEVINPNNGVDQNSTNDQSTVKLTVVESLQTNLITLSLTTDDFPNQTSWSIKEADGTILASGGPYGSDEKRTLIEQSVVVNNNSCYVFEINDTSGDGICCNSGSGSFKLTTDDGEVIHQSNGDFGFSESVKITIDNIDFEPEKIQLYPNPSFDGIINVLGFVSGLKFEIYSQLGQKVYEGDLTSNQISVQGLIESLYYIKISNTETGENIVKPIILVN